MVELNILAENLIKIEEVKDEPVEINEEYSWSLNELDTPVAEIVDSFAKEGKSWAEEEKVRIADCRHIK
ncbi:hypothetical protein R5R35_006116 [Gryllus longicercus]|uniref:Uncharacterized protein n=1 Tax=Gryllus longicercus TaxID=2509291 RepID=A0AAN9VWW4_9ORTH